MCKYKVKEQQKDNTLLQGTLNCDGFTDDSKPNATCLAIKTVTSLLLREDLRTLYYSYVHSIMTDDIIYYIHIRKLGISVCVL
jgi:hypothetical protein